MVRVVLKPRQGIKVDSSNKYLFDPAISQAYDDLAKDWATKTDGLVESEDYSSKAYAIGGTGTETNNSKYYSQQAATSATNASTSETNAGISATTASTQAGIATNKANDASASATTATTQAGIAIAKAGEASTSATNAGISETNAGNSANAASASASLAHDWATSTSIVESGQYGSRYYSLQAYNANVSAQSAMSSASTYATNSSVWAEGTDAQVQALGGTHSAKVWVESIGTVYKAAGSVAFASLPTLGAEYEGYVYNVTDSFTTTSDFVEGAGKDYPAGTNVVCIDVSGVYKWDILGGFVDLTGYATETWVGNQGYITGITSSDVTTALGYTPYNSTNPDGYISGITSGDVTNALGYTPYNSSNPNGYTSNIGTVTSVNNTSPDGNGNVTITIPDALPSQTGHSGEYLTTDGTDASWATISGGLPSQTGQSGKFLTTDGTDASWASVDALPSQTGHSGDLLTTDGTDASWVDTETIYPVVETYINGTEWYRVYSDGWVEQGGQDVASATGARTITLLKPFADSNYTVTSSIYSVGAPVDLAYGQGVGNKTTTTFQYYCRQTSTTTGGYNLIWMACGYGA